MAFIGRQGRQGRHKWQRQQGWYDWQKRERRLRWMKRLGWLPILLAALTLLLISHLSTNFAIWYAVNIFPFFVHTIGRFFGFFPFSVMEILLILTGLVLVWGVISTVTKLFSPQGRAKLMVRITIIPFVIFYFLSVLFLLFVLTSGINYGRESYAYHIGIEVEDSSADELIQLFLMLVERAEDLSNQIEVDEYGHFMLNRAGLYVYARQSMHGLHELYGGLGTYFPRAKAPVLSRLILSNFRISGFFSPWTMEAHYNGDMPGQAIPFIINHELAHFIGHMREDEANFIAYLAARDSVSVNFQYSAVYMALNYVLNALGGNVSAQRYGELFDLLPEQIVRDFAVSRAYWRAFDGPMADLQVRVNDAYLRLNQQEDGVQSYGRMVDLMLAYYRVRMFSHQ